MTLLCYEISCMQQDKITYSCLKDNSSNGLLSVKACIDMSSAGKAWIVEKI